MNACPPVSDLKCHHCGSEKLRTAPGYTQAYRVTSDCQPWPTGGLLALCEKCGLVQTIASHQWREECERIYQGYAIYHQSGGVEQPVFDSASGANQARSDVIITALMKRFTLPTTGRWLDIGCGNGAMLRACNRALPSWMLYGSEVGDKYKQAVERIPRVERLFSSPVSEIPGSYDVISLIHVIEHIPHPCAFLQGLSTKLTRNGLLLIEVPDCQQNSFMLMVADHCSHFSTGMMGQVLAAAGYDVQHATTEWVPKEITAVAHRSPFVRNVSIDLALMQESEKVFGGWTRLRQILHYVEQLPKGSAFGIFGTSIAATWLDAQTGDVARFFVDEDLHRIGKRHLGRPIYGPNELPSGSHVFLALPFLVAKQVAKRNSKPSVTYHLPPEF